MTGGLLPKDAREILRKAASGQYKTEFERTRAIEQATAKVKRMYPQFFIQASEPKGEI